MQHLLPGCQPFVQPHQLLCLAPVQLPATAFYSIITLCIWLIDSFNSSIDIHNEEALSLLEDQELQHLELHGCVTAGGRSCIPST